ncbi:MAG: MFS transporter [Verrucomicrobiota bacterium]
MNNETEEYKKNHDDPMRCGTITYTKVGLAVMFGWMLWGIFWFAMMNFQLIPNLLPLSLKEFKASNAMIGLLVGSLPAAINMVLNPIISFRSDRTRSKWGRRIPYLLATIPFTTLFLILMGWTPNLAAGLSRLLPFELSAPQLGLGLIAVFSLGFQFFNMFAASVYYYLFADVVPEKFMGRFMAAYNFSGSLAGFLFARFILPFAENFDNLKWIYTGVSLFYFITFMLLCWRVREGQYPPPSDAAERSGFVAGVKLYFRECFSLSYYRWFFLGTAINAVSVICRTMFNVFFARENLGMDMAAYGKALSWGVLTGLVLVLPLGMAVDRFRPIRVHLFGTALVVVVNALGFFMIQSETSFIVFTVLLGVVYVLQQVSNVPMYVELLPKERFGQFCSAQAMVQSVILIAANYGGGLFMDWTGDYRYIYVWDFMWTTLALVALVIVFRGWKKYGGTKDYVAPMDHVGQASGQAD